MYNHGTGRYQSPTLWGRSETGMCDATQDTD